MDRRLPLSLALVAAMAAGSAFAQNAPATLQIDSGSAMISTGGEFTSIGPGAQVPGGSRLMLTEGSRATLVYPNGCTKSFASAGVFNVTGTCVAGASSTSAAGRGFATGVDAGAIGLIAGGTLAVGAILANMDDEPIVEPVPPPPPVSR